MEAEEFEGSAYVLREFSEPTPGRYVVRFRDTAPGSGGVLTITVSVDVLVSVLRRSKEMPLSAGEVMELDGT